MTTAFYSLSSVRSTIGCLVCLLMGLASTSQAQLETDSLEVWALMRSAAEKVAPSVVQIETLGGLEQVEGTFISAGPSTGLIITSDGLVVTSEFAVIHQPTTILVRMQNGERKTADLLARDHARGLVLLRVAGAENLPVPEMVSEQDIQVGQWAVAIGRTFQPDQINTNVGIISAKDRVWGKALQTDAKVSPNNYGGPLVDARGRVLGVLCAISPRENEKLAGVDWYDSGIGFAVPISDIMSRLERWRKPEDLFPGKIGIQPTSVEQFATPVVVAKVGGKSPAKEAGLQVDDEIIGVDGRAIRYFPDLQHALKRRYAGETVTMQIKRAGEVLDVEVTLAQIIDPLKLVWLGILPQATPGEPGILVRYVFANSPAEIGGVQAGDRIKSIGDKPVSSYEEAAGALTRYEAGDEIQVVIDRQAESVPVSLTAAPLLADLPDAATLDLTSGNAGEAEVTKFQLEQFPNECDVILPAGFQPDGSFGLLVWIGLPGQHDQPALKQNWQALAAKYKVVVIAPHASEERRWNKSDIEIITGFIQRALQDYNLAPQKTVISGEGPGRNLAWQTALETTRPVQGIALLGMGIPPSGGLPENEPVKRLLISAWLPERLAEQARAANLSEQMQQAGLPTNLLTADNPQSESVREDMLRWLMTLDRL